MWAYLVGLEGLGGPSGPDVGGGGGQVGFPSSCLEDLKIVFQRTIVRVGWIGPSTKKC
jgi:hypothetical protein